MAILNDRKTKRSGKRVAVKYHFLLSTKEVSKKVKEAKKETVGMCDGMCDVTLPNSVAVPI
jgi:hypothetical protein